MVGARFVLVYIIAKLQTNGALPCAAVLFLSAWFVFVQIEQLPKLVSTPESDFIIANTCLNKTFCFFWTKIALLD